MRNETLALAGCLLLSALFAETTVKDAEKIRLWKGWNLIYLTVEPTESADVVFASWPVDKVSSYEAEAFNATRQYSVTADTEGLAPATMKMWYAGAKNSESMFRKLRANGVYVVNCTNESFTTTLYGVPHAARCVWHTTSEATSLANYVGLALDPAAGEVRLKDYFLGCTSGIRSIRRVSGYDTTNLEEEYAWGDVMGRAGEAFAFDASRTTDWSGPVYVANETGIDFGEAVTTAALTLRNDSGTNITVRMSLTASATKTPPLIRGLLVRRPAGQGGGWVEFSPENPYEIVLGAGATAVVPVALDRARNTIGDVGGIIRLTDVSAKTNWKTSVPVSATIIETTGDWMHGLWVADVTVDTTSYVNTNRQIVAAVANGTMRFRLPVVFAADERRYLVQRVETYKDDDGNLHYLVDGATTNGWTLVRRYSSVVLPVHSGPILAEANTNLLTEALVFKWHIDESSRDNPFRHARHPDHDGLTAAYDEKAPSGDNPENYLGDVKPELFSLENTVSFTFDAVAWTPAETLVGRCRWEVGGLHAAGALFAEGNFTMSRKSSIDVTSDEIFEQMLKTAEVAK